MHAPAAFATGLALLLFTPSAHADEPPDEPPPAEPPPEPPPAVRPPDDPRRDTDVTPAPTKPPTRAKGKFAVDPIADSGVLALGVAFGVLSSAILGTDEVRPQQISLRFTTQDLLWIDRGALWQRVDDNAALYSDIAIGAMAGYALFDSILDGFRDGASATLTDITMYLEAATITLGVTNLSKIAFRRPRPKAYIARADFIGAGGDYETYENSVTDSALSFFSGHSAEAAALTATATYIAFQRSPGTLKPWLTLAGGTALTSFIAYSRVRSASHFPTDVMAGALAGTAIGALIVHLHRADSPHERPIWIGAFPARDGGTVSVGGRF
ncbi:MAG: phosphatase PAP2 family protein [Labilithrix sp.]|nr:phosphatase PAP2 family protein [Labilithrix sp.]MCW5814412.1 phosphatase PAP2 family protein [Labilithrix sp.]